jgi:hypothetical protein
MQMLQGRLEQEGQTPVVATSSCCGAVIQIDMVGKCFAHRSVRKTVVGALWNSVLFLLVAFLDFFFFFGCSPEGVVGIALT